MLKRKIIKIDEEKCNGCGLCIPNCPEGALQVIDGKVRLISDLFCDGLGACIGHCPSGAINIEEREAEKYDEKKVMANIIKQGDNVISAHLEHLENHGEEGLLKEALDYLKEKKINVNFTRGSKKKGGKCGCPGSMVADLRNEKKSGKKVLHGAASMLNNWPVQIKLVPVHAPYFDNADLLIAADCAPFSYANFHDEFLKGKILLIGCPKLDDAEFYAEKLTDILKENNIRSITIAHMEVPCCFGLVSLVKSAVTASGKNIPVKSSTISIKAFHINKS